MWLYEGTITKPANCSDGNVRLVGGSGSHEGRVEVCMNQAWGTICDNGWDSRDGNIICNQLGFLNRGKFKYSWTEVFKTS